MLRALRGSWDRLGRWATVTNYSAVLELRAAILLTHRLWLRPQVENPAQAGFLLFAHGAMQVDHPQRFEEAKPQLIWV